MSTEDSVWPQSAEIYIYEDRTATWRARVSLSGEDFVVGPYIDLDTLLCIVKCEIQTRIQRVERALTPEASDRRTGWKKGRFVPPSAVRPVTP